MTIRTVAGIIDTSLNRPAADRPWLSLCRRLLRAQSQLPVNDGLLNVVLRHHALVVLILCVMAGGACNAPAKTVLPTAPTPLVAAVPAGVTAVPVGIAVSGKVYDTGSRQLAGATVEVMNGPSAGLTVTTAFDGHFNLWGAFDADTKFRATKAGYEAGVKSMSSYCERCNPHHWVYFNLALPVRPANIAGDYTLTVTADEACTALPPDARTRTYSARIAAQPTQPTAADTAFRASAGAASMIQSVWEGFWFAVAGDYVEVSAGDLHGQPGLVEAMAVDTYFSVGGIGATTLGSSGASNITTPFDSEILYCVLKPGLAPLDADGRFNCTPERALTRAVCASRKNQLVFSRR